jgi:hypothetical protein
MVERDKKEEKGVASRMPEMKKLKLDIFLIHLIKTVETEEMVELVD